MIMTNKLFTKTIVKADAHLQIQVRANYTDVIDHTPERAVFDCGRSEITRNWGKNQSYPQSMSRKIEETNDSELFLKGFGCGSGTLGIGSQGRQKARRIRAFRSSVRSSRVLRMLVYCLKPRPT
jgi:hypothetical protein